MFTSRAEFRLHLRADNADQRLTPLGLSRGLVGEQRADLFGAKAAALSSGQTMLQSLTTSPNAARKVGIAINEDGKVRSAFDVLSYPNVTADDAIRLWPEIGEMGPTILEQLIVDAQYAVYLDRQRNDIETVRRDEQKAIPDSLDYAGIPGLSGELKHKLNLHRPQTFAQAQAIEGMTPAAITLLMAVVRRGEFRQAS